MEPHNDHHNPNHHDFDASDQLIKDVTCLVRVIADDRSDIFMADMLDWLAIAGLSLHREPGTATNAYRRFFKRNPTAN